jgi:hypothetical protein
MANYLDGYQTVPDSGTQLPTPCGTEEANEGKAAGGNKWAKRRFTAGPIRDYDESKDALGSLKKKD